MQTLNELGLKHKTDKASDGHNYLHFYERFLSPLRDQDIMLVEAGIGGYDKPDEGGQSLRMWREYFSKATIIGFDKFQKPGINVNGVYVYQIDQTDEQALVNAFAPEPDNDNNPRQVIDVFIDDASHVNPWSIRTFEIMFPLLKPGGIYIWEDIHTSFWAKGYQGVMLRRQGNHSARATDFLHDLQVGLQADTLEPAIRGVWDGHIEEMHFMRNTCVMIKRKH
jgi:hypothetical protein